MSDRKIYRVFLLLGGGLLLWGLMSLLTKGLPALAPPEPAWEEVPIPERQTSHCPVLPPVMTTTYPVQSFLPLVQTSATPPPLPPPLPPPTPTTVITPTDMITIRQNLRAQGLDLSFNKIGFHTGFGGNTTGLDTLLTDLDAACIPFFLKSVDDATWTYFAQQLMEQSQVPHTLVYRRTGQIFDVPNYDLPPEEAAWQHWQLHKSVFPPELDPSLVWLETVNEVDKNRSEWLAAFALETAELALADGYKWAAFGWASGEPEPEHWQSPLMLDFLRLVAAHPDQLAIALHEYSYILSDIKDGYPYKIGRFQALFHICDTYGIPRPTTLITEWGWEYQDVPMVPEAMADIHWAAWLYAAYPQVKGAAIWYLGGGFGGIADQAQQLIAPVNTYSQHNYFVITPGQGAIDASLFTGDPPS